MMMKKKTVISSSYNPIFIVICIVLIVIPVVLIYYYTYHYSSSSSSITSSSSPIITLSSGPSPSTLLAHEALGLYWSRLQHREKEIVYPNISWTLESINVFNSSVYFLDVHILSIKDTFNLPYSENMGDDTMLLLFTLYPKKKQLFLDNYHLKNNTSPTTTFFYQMMDENKLFCRNQFLNY